MFNNITMGIKLLPFLLLIIAGLMIIVFSIHTSATHTSKAVVTTKDTVFMLSKNIIIKGWVNYVGHPISNVLLDVMLRDQDGQIILREGVRSDADGYFKVNLTQPKDTKPGQYSLYIISECRDEHRDICTNQDVTLPITIVKRDVEMGRAPDNLNASNTAPKPFNVEKILNNSSKSQIISSDFSMSSSSKSDGENVICGGKNATLLGTQKNDIIEVNDSSVTIHTLNGNDTLTIRGKGNLIVCNGENNDVTLDNSQGSDTIYGGGGDDMLGTLALNDTIDGEDGNDILIDLGIGKNLIYGGNGNDLIIDSGHGGDKIFAGIGNDIIYSNSNNGVVHGGFGNDTLFGLSGNNTLYGDQGYDLLHGLISKSIIDGGPGFDICTNANVTYNCELIKH
jgi:RTX calcium-binding nonapeptide repeat (4 copies)